MAKRKTSAWKERTRTLSRALLLQRAHMRNGVDHSGRTEPRDETKRESTAQAYTDAQALQGQKGGPVCVPKPPPSPLCARAPPRKSPVPL